MNTEGPSSNPLDKIPSCKIDANGVFKYIQILVKEVSNPENSKYVVRGYSKYDYHTQIFEDFEEETAKDEELSQLVSYEVLGGGRIKIKAKSKSILVYGYSKTYGQCDHNISCQVIQNMFPHYTITWSKKGY